MIGEILSRVEMRNQGFRDVVYEWEEECARYFGVPVCKVMAQSKLPEKKTLATKLKRVLRECAKKILLTVPPLHRKLFDLQRPPLTQNIDMPLSLCFVMNVPETPAFVGSSCLPIFLDIWSDWEINEVARLTRGFKLFYLTSRDAYNRMRALHPSSNVHYMPLSIADKYHSENFTAYRNKTIDVIQAGRRNPVLHEYMMKYAREHGDIEYVYREKGIYVSTSSAKTWPTKTRSDYMGLLAASRVSLTGCSGVDNAREDTCGICTVTPRFYEAAVSGCALISRYPDNEEFRELNAARYFPNITSYEHFTECLERALSQTPEELYAQNHDFIANSLTSRRAEQVKKDIEALTCANS
ncbi:MAG: hypothetical protein IJP89_00110 [Synergistaceae bacterium]|nr:hypothetical protein [Synergistaceae bacterium]